MKVLKGFKGLLSEKKVVDILVSLWRNLVSCVSVMGAGISLVASESGLLMWVAFFVQAIAACAVVLSLQLARLSYYNDVASEITVEVSKFTYATFVAFVWLLIGTLSISVYLIVERMVGGQGGYPIALIVGTFLFLLIANWLAVKKAKVPGVPGGDKAALEQE
ncbi:hypothetical protein [Stenotrophomonas maltophilia]|uniref:hypothetical protein n=1 Tax=Stenotrophomonas maltophilia TaxID=40324 RepID=UPI00128E41D7|nr:hypothetical protein [Stenotrophomonas maltophilia]